MRFCHMVVKYVPQHRNATAAPADAHFANPSGIMTRRNLLTFSILAGLLPFGRDALAQQAPVHPDVANARLAASTAHSERARRSARDRAMAVRARLVEGDFRIGDRIEVRVGGEVPLMDTVTVLQDRRVLLRGIREVSLAGILRSELQLKLRADVIEVVRNATVGARPLMRDAVFGSVVRPGYLTVAGETTLDELLSLSGGLVPTAAVDRVTINRADTTLLSRQEDRLAIASARALDALELRDGDVLDVPPQSPPWDRSATISIVTLFLAPLITIFAVR